MERICVLAEPQVERALRRYVIAQTLFEQACYAVLDSEGEETPASRLLDAADNAAMEASDTLERALEEVVAARVAEAMHVAGLLTPVGQG